MSESTHTRTRFSYAIAFAERSVRRALTRVLGPHGLTVAQYTVLSLLGAREGLSNAQLARRSYITPQAMNEVMRYLERRELVRREPSPDHARIHPARLTDRGRALLTACDADVDAMEAEVLAGIDPAERDRIVDLLVGCARLIESRPRS